MQPVYKQVGNMHIGEYKINRDFSASIIELDGEHRLMKNIVEDRILP